VTTPFHVRVADGDDEVADTNAGKLVSDSAPTLYSDKVSHFYKVRSAQCHV